MGTIAQKLTYLEDTKTAIGNAIAAKGGSVTGKTFRQYATEISNLPSGGGDDSMEHYLNNTLTSYTVPASVTSLHNYCFSHLTNLKSINLNQVKTIGTNVFEYTNIESITFPPTVTNVLGTEFSDTPVKTIVFEGPVTLGDNSHGNVFNTRSIEKLTFKGTVSYSDRDQYNNGGLEKIMTAGPYGGGYDLEFVNVCDYMFYYLKNLISLTLPSNITEIGPYTISSLDRLKSLTLPSSVTKLTGINFQYMKSLEELIFEGDAPTQWGNLTSMSLFDILVPSSYVENFKTSYPSLANRIFATGHTHDYTTTELRYSNQTGTTPYTTVSDTVLNTTNVNKSNLYRVYIGDNVTEIQSSTFYNSNIEIFLSDNNSIETIGSTVFYGLNKDLNFPSMVTFGSGGSSVMPYSYCTPIFSNNLTTFGSYALANMFMKDFVIPDSVTNLPDNLFYSTTLTGSLTIGKGVASIGNNIFNFSSLSSISEIIVRCENVPELLYNNSSNVFRNTSIRFKSTVETLNTNAFRNCYVKEFIFESTTPPTLGTSSLRDNLNATIYVPAEAVETYKAAWSGLATRIQAIPAE